MIQTIGVIGAGLMGNGIAHVALLAGYKVILSDMAQDRVEKGRANIEANMGRQLAKAQISEADMKAALGRLSLTTDTAAFARCDLVIEAATENEALKAKIFADVCKQIGKDALLASNTSSISITRLASYTDRPKQFIGMHFFNPVPLMKLVEIIPGIATDKVTTLAVTEAAKRMGKITIEAADSPSFIVNRILVPMINEAVFALGEGVGSVEDIDMGMKLGANHPMGPLTLADFVGLDTTLAVMRVMYEGFADPKYRPAPLLIKYVEAGWYGRKSGRGFYDYSSDKPVPTR
jgi:3-hydroxybutyryl-CoA dehydrogenase